MSVNAINPTYAHALSGIVWAAPRAELWSSVGCDGVWDWPGLCLYWASVESAWSGESQVTQSTVGPAWTGAGARGAACGKPHWEGFPGASQVLAGSDRVRQGGGRSLRALIWERSWMAWMWRAALKEARARPCPVSQQQVFLFVWLQNALDFGSSVT